MKRLFLAITLLAVAPAQAMWRTALQRFGTVLKASAPARPLTQKERALVEEFLIKTAREAYDRKLTFHNPKQCGCEARFKCSYQEHKNLLTDKALTVARDLRQLLPLPAFDIHKEVIENNEALFRNFWPYNWNTSTKFTAPLKEQLICPTGFVLAYANKNGLEKMNTHLNTHLSEKLTGKAFADALERRLPVSPQLFGITTCFSSLPGSRKADAVHVLKDLETRSTELLNLFPFEKLAKEDKLFLMEQCARELARQRRKGEAPYYAGKAACCSTAARFDKQAELMTALPEARGRITQWLQNNLSTSDYQAIEKMADTVKF